MSTVPADPPGTARRLSPAKRALLAQRLRQAARAEPERPIPALPDGAPVPLSFAQERMWFLEQFAPGTAAYSLSFAVRLRGPLDPTALAAAAQDVTARHDSLRMRFAATDDGQPLVEVADRVTVPWRVLPAADLEQAQQLFASQAREPFDLAVAPLLRLTLARLAQDDHLLHVLQHHVVSDGWSSGILLAELAALYQARLTGRPAPPPPALRYRDYAAWQRDRLSGPAADRDVAHWREVLHDLPPLELPTDRPRPAEHRSAGAGLPVRLDAELVGGLRELARRQGGTLFMALLAGWQATLGRYAGADDFAVGTPVAGRVAPELEGVLGLFVNTLAVRADLSGRPGFATLLARTRDRVLDALGHQELPFERLVQELGLPREVSRPPIFQVLFALQNYQSTLGSWPGGLAAEWVGVPASVSRFDLSLYMNELADGGAAGWLVHNTDLFDAATAQRLADCYVRLLRAVVAAPDRPVADLDLLAPGELDLVLGFGTGPAAAAPAGTLADAIAAQAATGPDAPAVVCGDRTLSYRQLDRRANRLAHHLRRRGVGPESLVGVCMEQSAELAVALLGVLKAGAGYLPLDPEQPAARLQQMLDDARPGVLLRELPDLSGEPDHPPDAGAGPDQLAYVIYTSGSTGRPKGVAVAHRQLLRYLDGVRSEFEVVPGARYALLQSLSFDFSVTVFYLALCTGGSVHLLPRRGTGPELAAYLRAHRIDYLKLTPSHLAALAADVEDGGLLPARALILGGEASALGWAGGLARQGGAAVFNHYGPTEATVGATSWRVPPDAPAGRGATPIGRPLPSARAYLLDARLRPVPVGVPGEIHLGGDRLARGYLNQPGLTADRFLPDPFGPAGARMYRTGDLGRWDAEGRLHFLGRADQQLKLRGYRVEPGEIEAVLAQLPGIALAAVQPHGGGLVAYLEQAPGAAAPDDAELRLLLGDRLPDYMIPTWFVRLDRLPRQDHGKIDRRALPAPQAGPPPGGRVPPEGPVEAALAGIWAAVLGRDEVGVTDDFFHLGGHSLLAIQVVARFRRAEPDLPRPVGVVDLFRHRTVRELAALATGAVGDTGDGLLHELTRPVPAPARTGSIVAVPYGGASAVVYQPLADALPAGWALHAVAVPGHDLGLEGSPAPIEEVARRCVEEILATVTGPLVIYGHCGPGSALAVEIARRLEAAGRELAAVYLGGIFPFARPTGGLLGRLARLRIGERIRGDRVHANWLRAMGADLGALEEEQTRFLIRAMRADAVLAEEYYTDILARGVPPLRAPVVSVVGSSDPGVEFYQERYREWHFLAGTAALVVIDEGGHYFLKFRADELAEIVTTVHPRLADPVPAADPAADPAPPWQLAAVSDRPDPVAGQGRQHPQPSMRRFLAIAAGQLVSMTGSALTEFAVPLYIYLQTGSLIRFALFAVLGLLPGMLVAPFAGAVVDRSDRRRVMLFGDAAAGACVLGLGLLAWSGRLQIWHLYGFVGCLSVALAFQRIAYTSAIPQIVPKRYLGHANGVVQTALGVAQFLVPLMAVGLMAAIGLRGILLLDVASYAAAIGVLLALRFPRAMAHRRREGMLAEVAAGFRYSVGRPGFRAMLVFFAVLNLFLAPLFLLVSPLVLGFADLAAVGRVALAGGAGAVLGGVAMAVWGGPRHYRMRGVLLSSLAVAAAGALTGWHASLVLISVGVAGLSLSLAVMNGIYATIIQTKVPQRLHGRVIAVNTIVAWSTLPVAWALVAPVATGLAEPLLRAGGPLAGSVGVLTGTGPGRGIGLTYLVLSAAVLAVVAVAARPLARFDDQVPDAPPDDVVGIQIRRARLARTPPQEETP